MFALVQVCVSAYSCWVTEPELSRRQQNKIDAYRSIHQAAFELIITDGCVTATVETIARKAGVSPRTFFNYFRSKEEAVLGIRPPQVHVSQLTALAEGGTAGLFHRVLILLQEVIRETVVDTSIFAHRKQVFEVLPETRERLRAHMISCENAVQEAIVANFGTGVLNSEALESQPDAKELARALIVLAGAVFRFTYERAPFDLVSPPTQAVDESMKIFRKILKETL